MRARIVVGVVVLLLALLGTALVAFTSKAPTCYLSRERISGTNKICYYDCGGSEASITVGSHELCPLSIQR